MNMAWRYTTLLDLLDHWQTMIAGMTALVAAIITVRVTLAVEQRKVDRELDGLRKSLAVELRQLIPSALAAYTSLTNLGRKTDGPITTGMVQASSVIRTPLVYNSNVYRIGSLERDAMDVLTIYGLIETARENVRLIGKSQAPDDVSPAVVLQAAAIFLEACNYASIVLPKLRTGVAAHDDRDAELIETIRAAVSGLSP